MCGMQSRTKRKKGMSKAELIQCLDSLLKIEQNLRRSINQNIHDDTLNKHLHTSHTLYNKLEQLLDEHQKSIPDREFFTYIKQGRNALNYITQTVKCRTIRRKKA